MATQPPDPVSDDPPVRLSTGCNLLFALIVFLLLAGLVFWAWNRHPPDTPHPTQTGTPSGPPAGNAT